MDSFGITAVPGIRVGHYTDVASGTGCTVVLCENGAVGGVDVRGSAPGTRETDLLDPTNTIDQIHAVLLGGGSTFGLNAAGGVMQYLEENGVGIEFAGARIPIVPAAILFDLGVITNKVRPGAQEGYMASRIARAGPVAEGNVGAGTGATVGKLLGLRRAVQGGVGTASLNLGGGLRVGAVVAVNAIGGVYDPDSGQVVAGPISEDRSGMLDSMKLITSPDYKAPVAAPPTNTTIGVVATNAVLTKSQANNLATSAHDGLALAVRPAHLTNDGDTMFALGTGRYEGEFDINRLMAGAVICVSRAIVRGVQKAEGLGGIPSVTEFFS